MSRAGSKTRSATNWGPRSRSKPISSRGRLMTGAATRRRAVAQTGGRLVGAFERVVSPLGLAPGLRRKFQELAGVRAGEVRDRDDVALLPEQAIGEARNVGHVNTAADHAPALLDRL